MAAVAGQHHEKDNGMTKHVEVVEPMQQVGMPWQWHDADSADINDIEPMQAWPTLDGLANELRCNRAATTCEHLLCVKFTNIARTSMQGMSSKQSFTCPWRYQAGPMTEW